jgi:hypothetical protein
MFERAQHWAHPPEEGNMRRPSKWILAVTALSVGIAIGSTAGPLAAQPKNVLVSKKASAPPPMEPAMGDAWKGAQPLTVKAIGGKNLSGGSTEVMLYSVYTSDSIYFLM